MPGKSQGTRLWTRIQEAQIERTYARNQTLRASASQAVSTVTIDLNAYTKKVILFFIDVTDVGAGPGTLTLTLQYNDPGLSTRFVNIKALGAFNSVATRILAVGLGFTQADAAPLFYANWPAIPNTRMRISAVVAVNAVTWELNTQELDG